MAFREKLLAEVNQHCDAVNAGDLMHLHSHVLLCPGGVLVVVTEEKNMKILCGCKVVAYEHDRIVMKKAEINQSV